MDFGDDSPIEAKKHKTGEEKVDCPICCNQFAVGEIEGHVNACMAGDSGAPTEGASEFPAVSAKKAASPASKNLQQWSELQFHQLDGLVSDLSVLKSSELEVCASAPHVTTYSMSSLLCFLLLL
jgi:hypothetical protein